MRSFKYNILLVLIICIAPCCSDTGGSMPVRKWHILYTQDPSLDQVSQKNGWQSIAIPSTFKLPYPFRREFQYVWLRGEFFIKDDPALYHGFSTGKIRLLDSVYVNNYCIGSSDPGNASWIPVPRNYAIPSGILKKGKNLIHIQLGVFGDEYCGISGNVLIQPKKDFDRSQSFVTLFYRYLPFGILELFIAATIVLLIFYCWDRKNISVLYVCIFNACIINHIVTSLPPLRLVSFDSFNVMQFVTIPFIFIIFILMVQSIYGIYFSHYNRIIVPILFTLSALILVCWPTAYHNEIGYTLKTISLTISIPYLMFIIYRLHSIKQDRFLLSIIAGVSFLFCLILTLEVYCCWTGSYSVGFGAIYLPLLFILLFTFLVSREIMKKKRELALLYAKLNWIDERSKTVSITDSTESKMKNIVDFIRENFTADISKEGLAAAVGLNPNYMSRLFRVYTGMKLGEYINMLRIEESVRRLQDKNARIIDIAFEVGFENIMTFNRAFKAIMKKTPSEYRNHTTTHYDPPKIEQQQ